MQTVTYQQVVAFVMTASAWLGKDAKNEQTKLGYAIQKVKPKAEKLWGQYQQQVEDLNIDHCFVDEQGVIVKDEKGEYKFTKEELKKKNRAVQELFESEVEVGTYFATDVPKDLTAIEISAFTDFVLKEQVEVIAPSESGAEASTAVS